jgi:hypothetical protein
MKVTIGTLPVGARFTFASPIEHEVVAQGDMGTTIRKTSRVAKTVTDPSTGKSTRVSAPAKSTMISSAAVVNTLP